MYTLFIILLSLSSFAGIESLQQFSANSRRETFSRETQKAIGFVKIGTCTGYFVKSNDKNRSFISSSRHCFRYKAAQWCKSENGFAKIHSTQEKIKCLGIAAGDLTHDIIVLEFENINRDRSGDFSYALSMPSKGTRLEMIGFPKDGFLADNTVDTLISTHNCRIVETSAANIYTGIHEIMNDKVFRHDCSTYGGNSGGPMLIEGTRIVVGSPDQYIPGSIPTAGLEKGKSIQGVRVDAYVKDLKHDLDAAGIDLVNSETHPLKKLHYFSDGIFKDTLEQSLKVTATNYYSDTILKEFTISDASETRFNGDYTCEKENECVLKGGNTKVILHNSEKFSIKEESDPQSFSRQTVE